jgi:uncharacterized protein (DUF488 family)
MGAMRFPFFTIGHSTRPIPEFVDLLRAGGVRHLVDVRTVPRSRTNPQYDESALPLTLAEYQLGHSRIAALGGLRKRAPEVPDTVNGWWKNRSFHNYADHALSEEFGDGLELLIGLGREQPTAVMCSEALWWRCHRRIIADHLLARGEAVFHIMAATKIEPAKMSSGARVANGTVTYPGEAPD